MFAFSFSLSKTRGGDVWDVWGLDSVSVRSLWRWLWVSNVSEMDELLKDSEDSRR